MLARFTAPRARPCAAGAGHGGLGHRSAARCGGLPARIDSTVLPPFSRFAAGTCRYNARRRKIPVATHKSQQIRIIIVYTQQLTRCPRVALPGNPVEGAFIMELLLSLLVGCGISLILFYRK
ncbi:conserved hypothetical protein [Cupriavidus taiwanensis]|nr:conserved hypothetical protein [Cupriavidus taiwanensis]SPA27034.1 conserved hypothetical protein [Cupriavidus taiwanensis]